MEPCARCGGGRARATAATRAGKSAKARVRTRCTTVTRGARAVPVRAVGASRSLVTSIFPGKIVIVICDL